jgi:hypothetical protein
LTPVEAFPTPLPNGYLFSSNYEKFPAKVAAASSENIQTQGVGIQEATKVPLHNGREMNITGDDSMGGVDLPQQHLSSFESHILQPGKLNYLLLCIISNHKNTEAEYDLGYAVDGEELVLASMHLSP